MLGTNFDRMDKLSTESLESVIREKFCIHEPEWVEVNISPKRKIDVTIVTEQSVTKQDVKECIRGIINSETQFCSQDYSTRFINIYTSYQALEMGLFRNIGNF